LPELVHIVDDDELVRASISYVLSNHGYSTQVYTGGAELFCGGSLTRGCILLDLSMPDMSGHEVQEELARRGNILPVVVMSAWGDPPAIVRAIKLGAIDFIEKPASAEDFVRAVEYALASFGKSETRRNVALAATTRLNRLTPREREILQGLVDGLPNKGIAHRLGLSSRTVEMYRASMLEELGLHSLSEAVQFAIEAELTPVRKGAMREMGESGGLLGA
jgi:two-component system response regulator FixJ